MDSSHKNDSLHRSDLEPPKVGLDLQAAIYEGIESGVGSKTIDQIWAMAESKHGKTSI